MTSKIEARMSECLDGRLSREDRSQLMHEIAASERLGAVWQQMREAQELALSLPSTPVSRSFREDVWQRIQDGEGAAVPSVLQSATTEPLTRRGKVTYGLLGAAAAAIFVVAVQFAFNRKAESLPDLQHVAGTGPLVAAPAGPTTTVDPNRSSISARLVAQRAANKVDGAVRQLRSINSTLSRPLHEMRGNTDLLERLQSTVRELEDGVLVLHGLQQHNLVVIRDSRARDCLDEAQATLERWKRNDHMRWPEDYQQVLRLSNCSLQDLPMNIGLTIPAEAMFRSWFEQQARERERLFHALRRMLNDQVRRQDR